MENQSTLKDMINSSLEQVRTILDADTVVGKPIATASGTEIIPISRISMGFASGGLDLPAKNSKGFGGGGGTGITVYPIGFLTVYADGRVEMLPMTTEKATPIEQIADAIDRAPEVFERVKSVFNDVFSSKKADAPAESAAEEEPQYDTVSVDEIKSTLNQ